MRFSLKEIRKDLGMTQMELSSKSGITRQTISRIEDNSGYSTSTDTLEALANALGVPLAHLFGYQAPAVELKGHFELTENGNGFLCEYFSSTRELMELLDRYGNRALHTTVYMETEVVRIPAADGGLHEEK